MGFKAITVNTPAEQTAHIYAQDDAAIYQGIFGTDGVLSIGNALKSTVISNNTVRISDGVLCVGGHIGRIGYADYQDMTIENGESGYNRNDIIFARFLTSGDSDTYILSVKKGTPVAGTAADPVLTQGDLYRGEANREYPLWRVKLEGLNITAVEQLFWVAPPISKLWEILNIKQDAMQDINIEIMLQSGVKAVSGYASCYGKTVTINVNVNVIPLNTGTYLLFILPEKYRPPVNIPIIAFDEATNNAIQGEVRVNGGVWVAVSDRNSGNIRVSCGYKIS